MPQKNIIEFMGKPMIGWTIEAAYKAGLYDRVLVSTDSKEIAKISEEFGAAVPFFRNRAFDDHAPVSEATCVAVEQCITELGEHYDVVTQLMANTPLRTAADIRNAMTHFLSRNAPAQISCFAFGWMNPWWAVTLDENGKPNKLFPEVSGKRSQDLPKLYCPSGAIWIARKKELLQKRTFKCPGHCFFPMPWQSAVDIDDEDDFNMALAAFKIQNC